MSVARLQALRVEADPERWRTAGFDLDADGRFGAGGVTIHVTGGAGGVTGWCVEGVEGEPDGLGACDPSVAVGGTRHANGTVALDHVVLVSTDLERSMGALAAAGLQARRVREAGRVRQAFYVLQTSLAELVAPAPGAALPGPLSAADPARARFWGLTFSVADLDATAARLGDRLGPISDAVQAGRRIATVGEQAGLTVPVAFMTPRAAGR